jgi:hypothetical protein
MAREFWLRAGAREARIRSHLERTSNDVGGEKDQPELPRLFFRGA